MKKKVLIFLQSEVGGAERVSVTIGKNLDKEFFDVYFYAVGPWNCNISDFIPSSMFKEHLKHTNPFKLLLNLYKVLRRETPRPASRHAVPRRIREGAALLERERAFSSCLSFSRVRSR